MGRGRSNGSLPGDALGSRTASHIALPAEPKRGRFNAVIETPKGSRNKFTFVPELGIFQLGKQLPTGAVFPFDIGFIPSTRAPDGDPLDVLVLLDDRHRHEVGRAP